MSPGCRATHRCAVVGSTSRHSVQGATAYSAATRATRATQASCARLVPARRRKSTPTPASRAAISWTTTPNRAYARNIGTTAYSSADGATHDLTSNQALRRQRADERGDAQQRRARARERRTPIVDLRMCQTPSADGDAAERDGCPNRGSPAARASRRARQPHPHAMHRRSEQRMRDRRNEIAPPLRAVSGRARLAEPRSRAIGRRQPVPRTTQYASPPAAIEAQTGDRDGQGACAGRLCAGRMTSQYAATAAGVMTAAINPP